MTGTFRRLRAALLVGLAAACAACAARAGQSFAPDRLLVAGPAERMGRCIGQAYGEHIRAFLPYFRTLAVLKTGRSAQELKVRLARLAMHVRQEDERMMRGVAEGAQVRYEDVLFLNLWYHLVSDRPLCRQLAAWGEWTEDGRLIHARNLDWPALPGDPLYRHNLILDVRPAQGIDYVALTWPGLVGVVTGTNRCGITVGFNQLAAGRGGYLAEPVFLTLRRVLRTCKSAQEAADLIRSARPMGNGSILISDARRRTALVVEVYDGHVGIRRPREGLICNANHVTTDLGLAGVQPLAPDWPACAVARELGRPLTVEKIIQLMRDHRVLDPINMLSAVFVPEEGYMLLSCGRPLAAKGDFARYDLFPDDRGKEPALE